jgi:hypothetical protein
MIVFLTTKSHTYTVKVFRRYWARTLSSRMVIVPYEDLAGFSELPCATYVFTDLERLTRMQTRAATLLWDRLEAERPRVRVLNHPGRCLRRRDLLVALREAGINDFAVHSASARLDDVRLPAFVRLASDHDGARTPLLQTRKALADAALRGMLQAGDHDDVLIVEFCDTRGADGRYRKYSAFRVGERVLAAHVFFSRKWMLKHPDEYGPAEADEERAFTESNPHEAQIRRVFELSGIEYGRIDYGLRDGRIQVWEINTNPVLNRPPEKYKPAVLPARELLARQLEDALESVEVEHGPETMDFRITPEMLAGS